MQFDNVIIFARQVATSRNFFNRVTTPKTASFQNLTEAAMKLMAARFRALGESVRARKAKSVRVAQQDMWFALHFARMLNYTNAPRFVVSIDERHRRVRGRSR
jgi:hypothetical protein